MAKNKKKLEQYKEAVGSSRTKAHSAIQKAEDALFQESDRQARRSQDQAASRANRGLGVR